MPTPATQSPGPLLADFIATADAALITSWLQTARLPEGLSTMRWLLSHRADVANQVLCLMYGVWWYQVKDSCFSSTCPEVDQDRWFVGVPDTPHFEKVTSLPLRDSADEVCADAVREFGLEVEFFRDAESTDAFHCAT